MGRQVTGCTAGTEQSRTDPSVVFVPTDLSILARSVTNVYVTTRQRRGAAGAEAGKNGKERKRCGQKEEKKTRGRIVENEAARRHTGLEERG